MSALGPRPLAALIWLALGVLVAPACQTDARDPAVESAAPASTAETGTTDPAQAFSDLEDRLLQRPASRIGFRITAEGAFTAALDGELFIGDDDDVHLASRGTFGPDSVLLSLEVADGQLIGGNGDQTFAEPVPSGLREALVIGLTRMGLLHNLARLVAARPPDRADGTVRSWVQAREPRWTDQDEAGGGGGIAFDLWVSGQPTAEAVLWLDERGLPVRREQTVRFPGGEMRVREQYEIR